MSRAGSHRLLAAVFVAISISGCSSEGIVGGDGDATPLACDSSIDTVESLPDWATESLGAVAFGNRVVLQRGRTGTDNDPLSLLRFAKTPLFVRPGTESTIRIERSPDTEALISWSSATSSDPVASINVACPGDPDSWLVFAGGVWTVDPTCLTLEVVNTHTRETVQMPVGQEC